MTNYNEVPESVEASTAHEEYVAPPTVTDDTNVGEAPVEEVLDGTDEKTDGVLDEPVEEVDEEAAIKAAFSYSNFVNE